MRSVVFTLCILFGVATATAQASSDFSGVWVLDESRSEATGVYGQMRIIKQSPTLVEMTAIHAVSDLINVIPWQFRMNRWGPRRGGEESREPLVQARWDGEKLIAVKAPGENYSGLWIWSLESAGQEMVVEAINWTSIPTDFNFKEAMIPAAYARYKYVYTKKPASDICATCNFTVGDGKVSFQVQEDLFDLAVTCHVKECELIDVVAGKRGSSRKRSQGGVAHISLSSQTIILTASQAEEFILPYGVAGH
jgi:hypothetical protein